MASAAALRRVISGSDASPVRRDHIARLDEGHIPIARTIRPGHQCAPEAHELVDVELVIGEQDEVLVVLRRSARIVTQSVQRVIDARRA